MKPVQQFMEKSTLVFSLMLTALLFVAMNVFFMSLLNSADDAFIMYPMSGGYGAAPTNLLHYRSGWHYWLSSPLQILFSKSPNVNWYCLSLLLFHFVGCTAICWVAIRRLKAIWALLFYLSVFYFIETKLLFSLTYTGASLVSAIGAGLLIIHCFAVGRIRSVPMFAALLILLLAGLLRLHVALLVGFILLMVAVVVLQKRRLFLFFATIACLLLVLVLSYRAHENYYRKHIPHWEQREQFSQALIYIFNRPIATDQPWQKVFKDTVERDFFSAGLYYDSTHFTTERLKEIGQKITRRRWMNKKQDWSAALWIFNDVKVFLALAALIIASLWIQQKRNALKRLALLLLPVFACFGYLFVFEKVTFTLQFGFLMMVFVFPVLLFNRMDDFVFANRKLSWAAMGFFALLFLWRGVRIVEQHWINVKNYSEFRCAMGGLLQHPDKLFLATDEGFPVTYFNIWDAPSEYPMKNILYKNWWLSNGYPEITNAFGIYSVSELMQYRNLLLLGTPAPVMQTYYPDKTLSMPLPGYQCLEVRNLLERK